MNLNFETAIYHEYISEVIYSRENNDGNVSIFNPISLDSLDADIGGKLDEVIDSENYFI